MRKIVVLFLMLLTGCFRTSQPESSKGWAATPVDLRCEYLIAPLALETKEPRLSWKVAPGPGSSFMQGSYRILVASHSALLVPGRADMWDSGEVQSDESVNITYEGVGLGSDTDCFWTVRVTDRSGHPGVWAPVATWSTGLFSASDWQGVWLGTPGLPSDPEAQPADPWFRKDFHMERKPVRALLYLASIGFHEVYVNGTKVSDQVLAPDVADLRHRCRYRVYDLAPLLQAGENTLGVWLGGGWVQFPLEQVFARPAIPLFLAQLNLDMGGGFRNAIVSDATWKAHASSNHLMGNWWPTEYGGEKQDGMSDEPDWASPGLDLSAWTTPTSYPVQVALTAERCEPTIPLCTLAPVAMNEARPGVWQIDFGRSFTGWVEVPLAGPPGSRIDLYFTERIDQDSTFGEHSACILGPTGAWTFRNRFNYLAGRWVTITGLTAPPDLSGVKGLMLRSNFDRVSSFTCSNPLLNQICDTILWTYENLSLGGYMVDCPHRERMGYGGDAHSTLLTGLDYFGTGAFYSKWAEDWRDVQLPSGEFPHTAPTQLGGGGPFWSGFPVTLTWKTYLYHRDQRILQESYPSILQWLAFLDANSADDQLQRSLIERWDPPPWGFLGDWAWPGGTLEPDDPNASFFNNCLWSYNLAVAADIADTLGRPLEAAAMRARADAVRAATHAAYFDPVKAGYITGDPQYLAFALLAGVPPLNLTTQIWASLENSILVKHNGHIFAGIPGGYVLMELLMNSGRNDLIATMALQTDYPGWGYMLGTGATTLWETWEGDASLLHSSYLFLGPWFLEHLGGIQPGPAGAGFKDFVIAPWCGAPGLVDQASATHLTDYGLVSCDWSLKAGRLALSTTVPPNTTATLYLPTDDGGQVMESGRPVLDDAQVTFVKETEGVLVLRLGSGVYSFEGPLGQQP